MAGQIVEVCSLLHLDNELNSLELTLVAISALLILVQIRNLPTQP